MGGIAGKRPRVAARCDASDDAASPSWRLRRESALDDSARSPDAVRGKDALAMGGAEVDDAALSVGTETDDDETLSVGSSFGFSEEEEDTGYSSAEEFFFLSEGADFSAGFDSPGRQVSSSTSSTAKLASAVNDAKIADGSSQVLGEGMPQMALMIETKKAAAAAADALNKSKEREDMDDTKKSKGPLFSSADLDAKRAMARVKHLHFQAMQSKEKMPPVRSSKSKIDQIHSAIKDRAILVIQAKDKTTGHLSSCSEQEFMNRKRGVCRNKEGIDLIIWKGKMAIPSSSLTGNRFVDEMNAILFGLYGSTTVLLERSHIADSFARVEDEFSVKKDTKDAIFVLRKTVHDIRRLILEIGGLPLREPVEHWRTLPGWEF